MPRNQLRLVACVSLALLFITGLAADDVKSRVDIKVEGGFRHITSNGIPNHETGKFPNRGNPNSIRPQDYKFKVPIEPKVAKDKRRAGGPTLFGVALSGVPFDPGTAEWWEDDPQLGWNYEAIGGSINLGIDSSNAHVQPSGAYHYHGIPSALVDKLAGKKKDSQMTLVAWAADGYPVYATYGYAKPDDAKSDVKKLKPSYRIKSGTRPGRPDGPGLKYDGTFTRDYEFIEGSGDLDECNGRTGVTPEFPKGTYYYVLTEAFPNVPRLFHGEPDQSFEKKRGPGPGPGGRRGRRPPPPP